MFPKDRRSLDFLCKVGWCWCMPSLYHHWQAHSQKPIWPLPLMTISKVPEEYISPHYGGDDATRQSQALSVQLGKGRCFMTRHPAQASGPPLISCKYYICIVLKKQTNRIATDRPSNHGQQERSEEINTGDIEKVLEVPPCLWPWVALALMVASLLRGSKLMGPLLAHH